MKRYIENQGFTDGKTIRQRLAAVILADKPSIYCRQSFIQGCQLDHAVIRNGGKIFEISMAITYRPLSSIFT